MRRGGGGDRRANTWSTGAFDLGGNPIALFPRHLASVAVESDFGAVDTRLRLRSVGRQHLDNTGLAERTIDGYVTLDLSAGLDLDGPTGDTRLDLRVINLLDEAYETTGYWDSGRWLIPAAGRHVLAGVHYTY